MASIHQRTVDFLRDISTIVNSDGRFIYGRQLHSSIDYANNSEPNSNDPSPTISLLPFTITISTDPDSSFDSTNISLIFSRGADVIDSPEREEEIITEMSQIAENFVEVIREEQLKPISFDIGNVQMQAEYHFWMGTNSGVVTTFTLNIKKDCNGGQPILVWILASSIWNDSGVWLDGQTWND